MSVNPFDRSSIRIAALSNGDGARHLCCRRQVDESMMADMGLPAEKRRYTIAEYLALEERSDIRHEFHAGEMLAMSGGTFAHSRINMNFSGLLHARLKGHPCYPLDINMRVRIGRRLDYVYADTSIVCGAPQFDPDDPKKTTILNPRVVIEVLSESTESYDRGVKFELYREVPSLEEYVLVSQREPLIESFLRQPDGTWSFKPWKGLEGTVTLRSLEITVPLSEVYVGVEFESPQQGQSPPGGSSPAAPSRSASGAG
jgi:Uma2 family endonuclease